VTGLSFLVPDSSSETVVARSSMERRARAAGARFERRGGWNVPVAYEAGAERERLAQTVAFADRSNLTKLELQAEPEALAAIVREASDGAVVLEPGLAARTPGTWWCPVTPARVLVLADSEAGAGARLGGAIVDAATKAGGAVSVVDVTSGLAALTLAGPGWHELLARFCAIDMRPSLTPVDAFRPGSVARTPGYLLREHEHRLLVLVGWALGEYLWEVVADAAGHLGGGPVGADALSASDDA
jgi:heterotetrameric sarcosine oxidase gamma subunit